MAQKSMMESVREEIVSAIKGTGDIVNAVVDTVAGTLTNTIKGTGTVATSLVRALSDTARASIQGVAQVGGDIGAAAKGVIIGALRGTKETSTEKLLGLPLVELSKALQKSRVTWERRRRVRSKVLSLGKGNRTRCGGSNFRCC